MTIFFDSWTAIQRTLIVGFLSYVTLIVLLRVSGKRTLSKWNAFDFIVTIALGSTLASAIISKSVVFAQGAIAFALLVGLQYIITWLAVRSPWVAWLIKAQPVVLLSNGVYHRDAMRATRVPEAEIRAALRSEGIANIADVGAVVLETDGSFSVIKEVNGDCGALADVKNWTTKSA